MTFWRRHYDGIYSQPAHAVSATVVLADSNETLSLTVVDETKGISILERAGGVAVDTTRPAVRVRSYELADSGVVRGDLKGSDITFNGNTWLIESTLPKPSPHGEAEGELYLVLIEKPS